MTPTEERHEAQEGGEEDRSTLNSAGDKENSSLQQRRTPRSPTKTRKSATTCRRIMDAATELMVERGNSAFQMSEVSRRCNMSKGALYYYFVDKEDLVNAVFRASVDDLVASIESVVASNMSPHDALVAICHEFSKRTGEGSPLPMAIVHELVQLREGSCTKEEARIHRIVLILIDLLDKAKDTNDVRKDIDTRLAAIAICGAYTFGALDVSATHEIDSSYATGVLDLVARGVGLSKS